MQMARDLKVTQGTVSAVELGQDPSLPFLASLADVYRLDESELRELAGQRPLQSPRDDAGNNVRRSELMAEFDELSDEDQERLLLVARAFKRAKPKQPDGQTKPVFRTKKA